MSIFDLLKKSPSSQPESQTRIRQAARHLPEGEKLDRAKGESGEGAFQAANCAIWNDIQRALESK